MRALAFLCVGLLACEAESEFVQQDTSAIDQARATLTRDHPAVGFVVAAQTEIPLTTATLIGCRTVLIPGGFTGGFAEPLPFKPMYVFFQHAGRFRVQYGKRAGDHAILRLEDPVVGIEPLPFNTSGHPGLLRSAEVVAYGPYEPIGPHGTYGQGDRSGTKHKSSVYTSACGWQPWASDPTAVCWVDQNFISGPAMEGWADQGPLLLDPGTGTEIAGVISYDHASYSPGAGAFPHFRPVARLTAPSTAELEAALRDDTRSDCGDVADVGEAGVSSYAFDGFIGTGEIANHTFPVSGAARVMVTFNGPALGETEMYTRQAPGASPTNFDGYDHEAFLDWEVNNPAPATYSIHLRGQGERIRYQATASVFAADAKPKPVQAYTYVAQGLFGLTRPPQHDFNSAGGSNSVAQLSTGVYSVRFNGVGGGGGNVQIAQRGAAAGHCKVRSWSSFSTDVTVTVDCYSLYGARANRDFVALYHREPNPRFGTSYLYSSNATSPYAPGSYSANGAGALPTITRLSIGRYQVDIPGQTTASASPLVTAYGSGATRCQIESFPIVGDNRRIYVRCHGSGALLADSVFSLSLTSRLVPGASQEQTYLGGYLFSNLTYLTDYEPSHVWQFNALDVMDPQPKHRVRRISTGFYEVTMPGLAGATNAVPVVTAYGTAGESCHVESSGATLVGAVGDTAVAWVRCTNASGAAVNARFLLSLITDQVL